MIETRYASPRAKALALELGFEDVDIEGTGRDGRVTLEDVRAMIPETPSGLQQAGALFWAAVTSRWSFRPDEEALLLASCRLMDEIARMQDALEEQDVVVPGSRGQLRAHPLVRELRESRLALQRLLGANGLGLAEAAVATDDASTGRAKSAAGRQLALIRHHGAAARG